jgi:hypothetical protein
MKGTVTLSSWHKTIRLMLVLAMGSLLLGSPPASAKEFPSLNDLQKQDDFKWMETDEIYQEVYKLCSTPGVDYQEFIQSALFTEIMTQSGQEAMNAMIGDPNALLDLYFNDLEASAYHNLMQWQPFQLAVQRCYPDDIGAQHDFVTHLIAADLVGKAGGFGAGGAMAYGMTRVFRGIVNLAPRVPYIGTWLPRVVKVGAYGMVIGIAGYSLNSLRLIWWGPTQGEIKEAQAEVDQMLEGTLNLRENDIETMKLYDDEIGATLTVLKGLGDKDSNRPKYVAKLDKLQKIRAEIAKRIQDNKY